MFDLYNREDFKLVSFVSGENVMKCLIVFKDVVFALRKFKMMIHSARIEKYMMRLSCSLFSFFSDITENDIFRYMVEKCL